MSYKNCIDCPAHRIEDDPDHDDWFCYDDVKVVCSHTGKNVTSACRPYRTRAESDTPDWCPLKKES